MTVVAALPRQCTVPRRQTDAYSIGRIMIRVCGLAST
jgi:hypothetical protein